MQGEDTRRFIIRGLAVDAGLAVLVIVYVSIGAIADFDGKCGKFLFFGGAGHPCSRWEHVRESLGYVFVFCLVYWWVVVPLLLAPPVIAWFAAKLRSERRRASVK